MTHDSIIQLTIILQFNEPGLTKMSVKYEKCIVFHLSATSFILWKKNSASGVSTFIGQCVFIFANFTLGAVNAFSIDVKVK